MMWWLVFLSGMLWGQLAWAAVDISPALLGMYRKTVEIDSELFTYAARYGVDHRIARAVVLQESGGNDEWVSPDGDVGYFQISAGLVRMLSVETNVEAGIKYLAQLQNQFTREDYVLAAYKLGPDLVQEEDPLPFKTLQYVIDVEYFKSVLQEYEPEVRRQAEQLSLHTVRDGESWESLAQTTQLGPTVLRLYNPKLAKRSLRAGATVAYPASPIDVLSHFEALEKTYDGYVTRIGDTPNLLAGVFRVDPQTLQHNNGLSYLHPLPVGKKISLSTMLKTQPDARQQGAETLQNPGTHRSGLQSGKKKKAIRYTVRRGDSLGKIALRYGTTVRALRVANGLRGTQINIGTMLRVPVSGRDGTTAYRVQWGDTLGGIAQRYNTTIATLVRVNKLRNRHVQAGKVLRIPTS